MMTMIVMNHWQLLLLSNYFPFHVHHYWLLNQLDVQMQVKGPYQLYYNDNLSDFFYIHNIFLDIPLKFGILNEKRIINPSPRFGFAIFIYLNKKCKNDDNEKKPQPTNKFSGKKIHENYAILIGLDTHKHSKR